MRHLFAFLALIVLTACASVAIQEFETYKTAFDKTNQASSAILDQLALQERALFLRRYKYAKSGTHFDPDLAPYFTDATDPPGTAAFRGSLEVVKAYNDLLYGLETGQTSQALAAKLSAMESATTGGITATSGVLSAAVPSVSAGLTASMTVLNTAFSNMLPFIQLGLKYRAQEEFRIFLVQNYDAVHAILAHLRSSTAVIFPILTAASVRASNVDPTGAISAEDSKRIETYRKLLADWVILIDATIKALDRAKVAAEAPPTISDTISGLTSAAIDMETASKSARTHLAELASK